MTKTDIEQALGQILEQLAAVEHERWAHWQRYLHSKGERQEDGSLFIPANLVQQWEVQIATPYEALSGREKESDRAQVHKYLPLIVAALQDRV